MRWLPLVLLGMTVGFALATVLGVGAVRRQRPALPASRADDGAHREGMYRAGMAELAGSLAHELNQPLTAITSNAQAAREYLLQQKFDLQEVREILDDIVSDTTRASEIVRGVRALILGEAPRVVPFDVAKVIEQALDLVRASADERHISLHVEDVHALPRAVGDPMEIQLVLLNLLTNALDAVAASPQPERHVSVLAKAREGSIRICVRDTGCGVAAGALDQIFRPFYTSKPKGMGLGLSFSRALMERNSGRIQAIRNSNQGMTFELQLRAESVGQRSLRVVAENYPTVSSGR